MFHKSLSAAAVVALLIGAVSSNDLLAKNARYINQQIVSEVKASGKWIPFEVDENPLRDRDISSMAGKGESLAQQFASGLTSQLTKWNLIKSSDAPVSSPFTRLRQELKERDEALGLHKLSSTLLPAFDARDKWPNCIHSVRDQQTCGSCWAFSSSGHLEDRFCITSNGAFGINDRLAPQNMVNCDFANAGCNGGFITTSINYLLKEGLVTEDCMAYKNKPSFCMYRCDLPQTQYKKHKCRFGSTKILIDHAQIQQEIFNNGPMVVGFDIYTDLYSYAGGIYEHLTGDLDGGHAVKIIGWYYDSNNSLIWICQNQWGTSWGDHGYFNIRTGVAGMDLIAWSCMADV